MRTAYVSKKEIENIPMISWWMKCMNISSPLIDLWGIFRIPGRSSFWLILEIETPETNKTPLPDKTAKPVKTPKPSKTPKPEPDKIIWDLPSGYLIINPKLWQFLASHLPSGHEANDFSIVQFTVSLDTSIASPVWCSLHPS